MLRNNGGNLWILGMKTEKVATIIETVNGGFTDAAGVFIYSNVPWAEDITAFIIENSTVTIAGINERNFNRSPVSIWFRETQNEQTREHLKLPWVYLSKSFEIDYECLSVLSIGHQFCRRVWSISQDYQWI